MEKKNEYVFNIGFNKNNPEHKAVTDLLNRMGHTKADYISQAIIFYESQKNNIDAASKLINVSDLEETVRSIIKKEGCSNLVYNTNDYNNPVSDKLGKNGELSSEDRDNIFAAINGFRT